MKVSRLRKERKIETDLDTENAEKFIELVRGKDKKAIGEFMKGLAEKGQVTKGFKTKFKAGFKEKALGVTGLEESVVGLNDRQQAEYVLDELKNAKSEKEKAMLMANFAKKGIITDNVKEWMKKLLVLERLKK